jgi:hypothetical protein
MFKGKVNPMLFDRRTLMPSVFILMMDGKRKLTYKNVRQHKAKSKQPRKRDGELVEPLYLTGQIYFHAVGSKMKCHWPVSWLSLKLSDVSSFNSQISGGI